MTDDKHTNELGHNKPTHSEDVTTIPVVKEEITISTREVVTGIVDVEKRVHSESVDIPLTTTHTRYREERVPVNRVVHTVPQTRYEGDNIVIPVVKEEQVVVKRLVLVEEIHLIKNVQVDERTETVELRSETATVNRRDPKQEFNATSPPVK